MNQLIATQVLCILYRRGNSTLRDIQCALEFFNRGFEVSIEELEISLVDLRKEYFVGSCTVGNQEMLWILTEKGRTEVALLRTYLKN